MSPGREDRSRGLFSISVAAELAGLERGQGRPQPGRAGHPVEHHVTRERGQARDGVGAGHHLGAMGG